MTTGAQDDLEKATSTIIQYIISFGMSKAIGNVSFNMAETYQKPFSEQTNKEIDLEAQRIADETYDRAKQIIESKKDIVEKLANELLKRETMDVSDIKEIIGDRPFPIRQEIEDYIKDIKKKKHENISKVNESKEKINK